MSDAPIVAATFQYADPRPAAESSSSGVSWPAIIGGAFASVALAMLMVTLGSGLGLASVSPWAPTGASLTTVTVMTGVWLIVLHWLAPGLAGYTGPWMANAGLPAAREIASFWLLDRGSA